MEELSDHNYAAWESAAQAEKLCSKFSRHVFTHQEKASPQQNDQKKCGFRNITVVENVRSLSFSDISFNYILL